MHCIAQCTVLHCAGLHFTLGCTGLDSAGLPCAALPCPALHCTVLHCAALCWTALRCAALDTLHYAAPRWALGIGHWALTGHGDLLVSAHGGRHCLLKHFGLKCLHDITSIDEFKKAGFMKMGNNMPHTSGQSQGYWQNGEENYSVSAVALQLACTGAP